jgi:ubiquinone/menaquinone biosynthesis C-methylase UbiE
MENQPEGINYESAWDTYAQIWQKQHPELQYIGDKWIGKMAVAANSIEEYQALIERLYIAPYITSQDTVLEIGIGGGRTVSMLYNRCDRLICADISAKMLDATRNRLGDE